MITDAMVAAALRVQTELSCLPPEQVSCETKVRKMLEAAMAAMRENIPTSDTPFPTLDFEGAQMVQRRWLHPT